jgi:hypothetical protein
MRNKNNKVSIEEATQLANEVIVFLDEEYETKSGASRKIASAVALRNGKDKKVATKSTDSSEVEMPDTLAYLFNFADDAGYTIISADTRIESPILCYTGTGNLKDTIDDPGLAIFLEGTEYYIERSIIEAERMRDSLITDILSKIEETGVKDTVYVDEDDDETKAPSSTPNLEYQYFEGTEITYSYEPWAAWSRVRPLLSVEWGQRAPFNAYIPKNCDHVSGKAPVGCVAVATAYILTYWLNKKSIDLNLDGYSINSSLLCNYTCYPNAYPGAGTISIDSATTAEAATAREQVAHLMERIGKLTGMDYGCGGSSATTSDGVEFLRSLGFTYGVPGYFNEHWELGLDYNVSDIISSLKNDRPVIVEGDAIRTPHSFLGIVLWYTYDGGHAWVLDGHLKQHRRVTVTIRTTSPKYTYEESTVAQTKAASLVTTITTHTYDQYSPTYIHNNWGNRDNNGYFVAGSFNSKNEAIPSNTRSGESGNYQYRTKIFPNIYFE